MKLIKKLRKGFTLIELVVVIAVIAILAAISVISYLSITNKAKESNDHMVIDQVNTLVQGTSYQSRKATVHDLVSELDQTDGFDMRKIQPELQGTEFVYCFDENMFGYWKDEKVVYPKKLVDKLGSNYAKSDVWFFRDSVDSEEEHSIYLKATPTTKKVTTRGGLDVGDQKDITAITLDRSALPTSVGGDLVIRTNSFDTTLTVNAPKDTVKHFGDAKKVDVIAVAHASYHENGTVQLIAVKEGHVKLEGKADVNGVYVYTDNASAGFEDIKITVDAGVEIPKLSRSAVEVQDGGTKVCTVVTDQAKDIYLFNEGIYEQIKAIDHIDSADYQTESAYETAVANALAASAWVDETNSGASANTQTAAQQLANEFNGSYDGNGKIADQVVEVTGDIAGTYTVKFNQDTREFETYQGDTIVTEAAVVEAVAEVAEVASDAGKTAEEAEAASALKGSGTEADPFLVYDYATMQKISDFYDKGYYYFAVDMSKTENGTIDASKWTSLELNGCFDGKNVTFKNLDNALFSNVKGSNSMTAVLSNFTIQVSPDIIFGAHAAPVVYWTEESIDFNNVNVAGTIIGYSAASYVGQCYSEMTAPLKLTFNNCISSAFIIGYGEYAAGFIGYSNLGATYNGKSPIALELNKSYFVGTLYSTADYYYSWGNNTGWFSSFEDNSANKDQYVSSTWNGNTKQLIGGSYIIANGARALISANADASAIQVGDKLSITGKTGSEVCDVLMIVGPNGSNGQGNYTGLYYRETVSPADGKYTTNDIKKFNIHINDSTHTETGIDGNDFYINHSKNGTTYGSYLVFFVEFSDNSRTNCIGVTKFDLK